MPDKQMSSDLLAARQLGKRKERLPSKPCIICECYFVPSHKGHIYCEDCREAMSGNRESSSMGFSMDRYSEEARKNLEATVTYYDPKEYEKGNLVKINIKKGE